MRFISLIVPAVLVAAAAACAAPTEGESSNSAFSEDGKDNKAGSGGSVAYGSCAYTRQQLMSTVSAGRAAAIARGFEWLDDEIPFNLDARHETYRTDCSGFVSMCWQLDAPGITTRNFGKSGSGTKTLGSYDDLVPADALVKAGKHGFIFLGWNDAAHAGACVLEQSSTRNDMQFRVRMAASLRTDGFLPVRADVFATDTAYRPIVAASREPAASPATETTSETCTPKTPRELCTAAKAAGTIQCGTVSNGCGGTFDCSGIEGLACAKTGERCASNRCISSCIPKTPAEACRAVGAQCDTVSNGCTGTVNCSIVEGYGCKNGEVCGTEVANKCSTKAAAPDAGAPAPSDDESTFKPTTTLSENDGDKGDDSGDDDTPASAEPAAKRRVKASSGCNAGSTGHLGDAGTFAALMLVLGGLTRRRRAA